MVINGLRWRKAYLAHFCPAPVAGAAVVRLNHRLVAKVFALASGFSPT